MQKFLKGGALASPGSAPGQMDWYKGCSQVD